MYNMYALIFFPQKIMGGRKIRYFCENAFNLVTNHGLWTTNKKNFGPELAARQGISYMKKVHGDLIIINLYQECVL